MATVHALVTRALREAEKALAGGVWFLSGVGIMGIVGETVHTLLPDPMRAEVVAELNEQLLRLAGRPELAVKGVARYALELPDLGVIRCHFVRRSGTCNLRVLRELDEGMVVAGARAPKPRPLIAHAKRDHHA